jgi:hypothetical protein
MIQSLCLWDHRYLGGPKMYESIPYQLKACVSGGLLYAAVHTLPSLILKYDLPCFDCETEEWYERMNLHSINVSLTQHTTVFTQLFVALMFQRRKERNVQDQQKLDFCSPVHANQLVRHVARIVL